jgi:hypothetical protein
MDNKHQPCADSDFSGYVPGKSYTGEHSIPWPPPSMHRHPSTIATPLAALGCVVASVLVTFLACYGLYALVWR